MFCPNCGKQNREGADFCAGCGTKLPASPQAQQTQQAVQYPAPEPQQPVSPQLAAGQPQAKDANPVLIFVITMLVGLILIAAFLLFIKPGYLINSDSSRADTSSVSDSSEKDDTSSKTTKKTKKKDSSSSSDSDSSKVETTTKKRKKKTETTTTAESETATETTTTTAATIEKPKETKATTDKTLDDKNKAYAEAGQYSTNARPSFDEFEWCFGQNGLIYTPSSGVDMITEPLGFTGGWKAMVIYNPSNYAGTFIRELDNVDIGINGDSVDMTFDWYLMSYDTSESYNEEDMADTLFLGSVSGSGFTVTAGDAELTMNYFWKADGKEYALGTMQLPDLTSAYVALIRP